VPKTDWKIEFFPYGEISAEKIDFSIDDHEFLIVFTPVTEINDENTLAQKSRSVGFSIPENSYDVKFDRRENFESDSFYAPPSVKMSFRQLNRLGLGIKQIMEFHYVIKNAAVYLVTAESFKLARYYDRLIAKHARTLQFEVIARIGEEGLDYAIKTTRYKG